MITHCASFSQWVGRCVRTCASFSLLWSFKVLIHSFFLLLNFDPSIYFIFSFTLLVLLRLNKCLLCKQASFRSHVFPLKTNFSYYFLLTIHIDDTFKVNEKKKIIYQLDNTPLSKIYHVLSRFFNNLCSLVLNHVKP